MSGSGDTKQLYPFGDTNGFYFCYNPHTFEPGTKAASAANLRLTASSTLDRSDTKSDLHSNRSHQSSTLPTDNHKGKLINLHPKQKQNGFGFPKSKNKEKESPYDIPRPPRHIRDGPRGHQKNKQIPHSKDQNAKKYAAKDNHINNYVAKIIAKEREPSPSDQFRMQIASAPDLNYGRPEEEKSIRYSRPLKHSFRYEAARSGMDAESYLSSSPGNPVQMQNHVNANGVNTKDKRIVDPRPGLPPRNGEFPPRNGEFPPRNGELPPPPPPATMRQQV